MIYCHYDRHLTNINGTFTLTSSFWLRPSSLFLPFLYIKGGATSSQINSLGSIQVCHLMWHSASLYLPSEPCIYTFDTLTHSYLVGRSMVVGIFRWSTCSLMCTNQIDMTAHTPAFFTKLGTTAGHNLISHLWNNAGRMVTHPYINWAHDCLTSVIKHKTFAPCYVIILC